MIVLFVCAACTADAFDISGRIRDSKSLEPLHGVNVTVQGTTLGAVSDSVGRFLIRGVDAGRYTLSVSIIGYKSTAVAVRVGPEFTAPLDIRLASTVLSMRGVQVTGEAYRDPVAVPTVESRALILSTSFVPNAQIEREEAKTLVDAMQTVPGAFVESRGRKVKQFYSVRGQKYPYPDYAVDGIWQREFLEMPYVLSASDIETIEVIRSSAVLLTGLSGMAGVIRIQTREYEKRQTSSEADYGSYGTVRVHMSHGSRINRFSYAAGVGHFQTEGPENKHAAERVLNFFLKAKWQPSDRLTLQASTMAIDGFREFVTAVPPADPVYWLRLEKFDPLKTALFTLKGYYHASERMSTEIQASFAVRKPTYESLDTLAGETTRYTEDDREWNLNVIQAVAPTQTNTLRAGFLYNHWIAPNGKRFYYGKPCDTETFAGVVIDEQRMGRIVLDAGLRWERTYLNRYGAFGIGGSAKGFNKVTAVVNEWQRPVLTGTLGAAYALDPASTLDFHAMFGKVKPRTGSLSVDLTEPEDETQVKIDFGIKRNFLTFGQASAVIFATRQENALVLSGKTSTLEGRVMELYLNRDQVQIGCETEWRSPVAWRGIQAFANAIYLYSIAEQDGRMVQNEEYPAFIANIGVYQKWNVFDLNVLAKYVSGFQSIRFAATSSAVYQALGNFLVFDAICGWNTGLFRNVRIVLELRNLTDQRYSTVIGYPDFGRKISFGIRRNW